MVGLILSPIIIKTCTDCLFTDKINIEHATKPIPQMRWDVVYSSPPSSNPSKLCITWYVNVITEWRVWIKTISYCQ